jgi:hypothetical protein
MEDYPGSLAQGSVLFSDSADWEAHAGPLDVKMCRPSFVPTLVKMASTGRPAEKLAAARALTLLPSENTATHDVNENRTSIVSAKGHPARLAMLSENDSLANLAAPDTTVFLAREAAAAALANLCASADGREAVVGASGITVLVAALVREEAEELLKYCCGALGNLASENQDAIAAAGGIEALISLAKAVGIKEEDEEGCEKASLDEAEEDNGLEINASIALRKLAIDNAPNYKKMKEALTESMLRYFLHAELPPEGLVPEEERAPPDAFVS